MKFLTQILKTNPHILSANLDREIKPKIIVLQDLRLNQLEAFKVVVRSPSVFKKSLQGKSNETRFAYSGFAGLKKL